MCGELYQLKGRTTRPIICVLSLTASLTVSSLLCLNARCEEAVLVTNHADSDRVVRTSYEQMRTGDFKGAIGNLKLALRADRNNIVARRYLAYCLLHIGEPREAAAQLLVLKEENQASASDLLLLGRAYNDLGNGLDAQGALLQCLKLDPKLPGADSELSRSTSLILRSRTASNVSVTPAEPPPNSKPSDSPGIGSSATQDSKPEKVQPVPVVVQPQAVRKKPVGNNESIDPWANFKGLQKKGN
ncbi:MAG TPA: tetratricopeptide repeat protein [Oculatellaceae cyanobacterium]